MKKQKAPIDLPVHDIVSEAEEELEREKLLSFWEKNKIFILTAVFGLIFGAAGQSLYASWKLNQDQTATAPLIEAGKLGEEAAYEKLIEAVPALPNRQAALTKLLAASKALQLDDDETAQNLFQEVSIDNSADPIFRDMARINHAAIMLRLPETKSTDTYEILAPIINDGKNAWHGHALLYQAVSEMHKNGSMEQAIAYLEQLDADNTHAALTPLVSELLPLYRYKQEKQSGNNNNAN